MNSILFIQSGYRAFRYELYKKLGNSGIKIEFLFIVKPGVGGSDRIPLDLKNKLNYKTLNMNNSKIRKTHRGPGLGLKGIIILFFRLSKELLKRDYNIIVTATEHPIHSKIAFMWAKILNKIIIVWTETWNEEVEGINPLLKIYHKISRFILKNADAVLVHGSAQKKYCMSLKIPQEKIFYFNHCSIDLSKKKVNEDKIWEIRNRTIILYTGKLIKIKGVDVLIKAFAKIEKEIKEALLLIVGDGECKEQYEKLSRNLKIKNIKFLGHVEYDDIVNYMKICDIFVLPSVKYKGNVEGWGLVLNEAASMSKPIVTTDAVGGAFDLVRNGWNGFVVKNGDVDELYRALHKLIKDADLRELMGKRSRIIFEQFNDYDKAINNLKKAINYTLNRHFKR